MDSAHLDQAESESKRRRDAAIRLTAPGTALRHALDMIIAGHMGALICVGDTENVLAAGDDGFKLDLYFEGGLDARIEVGTSHFISLPRFYMTGRRGSAEVNDWRDRTRIVTCREWREDDVKPVVTSAGLTKTMAPRDEKTVDESWLERPVSDVHDFYRNFTRAMDGKEEQLVTHAQMRRDLRIIEAAFESDRLGAVVKFVDN